MKNIPLKILMLILINSVSINIYSQNIIELSSNPNEIISLSATQRFYLNYTWYLPNNNSINGKTALISFPTQGIYDISCVATDSCPEINSTIYYKIHIIDSSSNSNPISYITLFPNPILSLGPKLIITSNTDNIACTIKIINSTGSILQIFEPILNEGSNFFDYSTYMQTVTEGAYFLVFTTSSYSKSFQFYK